MSHFRKVRGHLEIRTTQVPSGMGKYDVCRTWKPNSPNNFVRAASILETTSDTMTAGSRASLSNRKHATRDFSRRKSCSEFSVKTVDLLSTASSSATSASRDERLVGGNRCHASPAPPSCPLATMGVIS